MACKAAFCPLSILDLWKLSKSTVVFLTLALFEVSSSVRHSNTKPWRFDFPFLPSLRINFWAWADVLESTEYALPHVVDFTTSDCQCYQSPPVAPTTWPQEMEGSGNEIGTCVTRIYQISFSPRSHFRLTPTSSVVWFSWPSKGLNKTWWNILCSVNVPQQACFTDHMHVSRIGPTPLSPCCPC